MQVGSLQQTHKAVRCGVDAVVVQGTEAGGHKRSTGTVLAPVPVIVAAIRPVNLQVLACKCIFDGRIQHVYEYALEAS